MGNYEHINHMDLLERSFWDYGLFAPSGLRFSDIDGITEKKGRFLIIETKLPNVEILQGQSILFDQLLKTGKVTIFYLWGKINQPEKMQILSIFKRQAYKTDIFDCDIELVCAKMAKWKQLVEDGKL